MTPQPDAAEAVEVVNGYLRGDHAALCDRCGDPMYPCECGDDADHFTGMWCDDCCNESLDEVEG